MKINGLSHITFICKNLEKTTVMLQEIFAATEIYSSGDTQYSISKEKFFNVAGLWIAIMEGKSIDKTYNHIAFEVNEEDLPKFKEKIELLELEILPGRKRNLEEGNSIYFYDYDNHLFELHTGSLERRLKLYNS